MTAPNFDRLEALPAPEVARLYAEGEGHAMTCLVCFHTGASVRYPLPPACTPALLPLPSGKHLLFLPDLADPEACAYSVSSVMLPEVRRLLDLYPVSVTEGASL